MNFSRYPNGYGQLPNRPGGVALTVYGKAGAGNGGLFRQILFAPVQDGYP
jgi:hypothetical protein